MLLWNVEKALSDIGAPRSLKGEHNSNVFCLAFDHDNQKIFSGGMFTLTVMIINGQNTEIC